MEIYRFVFTLNVAAEIHMYYMPSVLIHKYVCCGFKTFSPFFQSYSMFQNIAVVTHLWNQTSTTVLLLDLKLSYY